MMKTYVTFGSDHMHWIDGKTFDQDCVAVIESDSASDGRAKAFELFGPKFAFEYPEFYWKPEWLNTYYPRGLIEVE